MRSRSPASAGPWILIHSRTAETPRLGARNPLFPPRLRDSAVGSDVLVRLKADSTYELEIVESGFSRTLDPYSRTAETRRRGDAEHENHGLQRCSGPPE